ncbi:putative transposase [Bradyrhizobium sp. USDA 3364]
MGWAETCAVDERMRFVVAVQKHEESFAAICRGFGVSRRIGYKWLARFEEEGAAGLFDRSRAPLRHPQSIAEGIAERCLEVRRAHPSWGPIKIRAFLERKSPRTAWPAASTIGELFDREGLTVKRKLRRRGPPSSAPFAGCEAANDVWCIDFKGWFLTGDGKRCEPLTITDAYSRYLLRCQALARTDTDHVWPVLDAAFREFGLPWYLRSDNGSPFASRGAGGLSRLSVKLIKAGVTPERIAPGKPQQNGRHERMHLTLLQDVASPPAPTMREQLKRLRSFQHLYNEERPHQSLDNATPADRYQASPRRFHGTLRKPEYADDQDVRSVRRNGEIKWLGNTIYISEALIGEPVGLAEDQDGWTVSYGPIVLGTIAHRSDQLRRPKRKAKGCGLEDNAARCPQGPQPQQQQT